MPTFGDSLKLYVSLVLRAWWQLAIGIVAAVIGVVTDIITDLEVPPLAWIGAATGVLVLSQFAAFRRLHLQLSHELAVVQARLADFEADANMPHQLAMRPLSSSFDLTSFSRPLDPSSRGLAVRCVIGTAWEGEQLELQSDVKIALRDASGGSELERWISATFGVITVPTWRIIDPIGEWVVTVNRGVVIPDGRGIQVDAQAILQVPFPASRRGWIATIVDVSIRKVSDVASPVWTLSSFYEFANILVGSTADLHIGGLSHLLPTHQTQLVGPVISVAAHGGNIEDFVAYPADWERASGARGSAFFTMDAGMDDQARQAEARRLFIASHIRSLMSREGFVGFERSLDALLGAE